MLGAGKYDEYAALVRAKTDALGVILIVIGGKQGSSFCCQAPLEVTAALPHMLRTLANSIEADVRRDVSAAQDTIDKSGPYSNPID